MSSFNGFYAGVRIFAAFAILSGAASMAHAQLSLACIAGGAVLPELRSEGITELTGDLVFNCSGGTSTPLGAVVPQTDIQVFISNPLAITSRLIGSGSEALLMIDDPFEPDQILCPTPLTGCSVTGAGVDSITQQNAYKGGRISVFQGVPASLNSVVFHGVPIDPPGAALDPNGSPLLRVIRITNIRVNASQFHSAGFTSVTASVSVSVPAVMPVNQQAIQTTGIILQGLVTTYSNTPQPGGFPYQQCTAATNVSAGDVTFSEGFGTSFKTRTVGQSGDFGVTVPHTGASVVGVQDVPGQFFNTETGFYNPLLGLGADPGGAGLADFGTRFKVTFSNVPAGVTITGPTGFITSGSTLTVHQTASETGPYNESAANTFTATSTLNSYTFVYEVTDADIVNENVTISFKASWGTGASQPALGTAKISAWFGPTSTDVSPETEAVALIPRWVDFSTPADAFTIATCPACQAPLIQHVSASPNILFPPNDRLVPVKINYTDTDSCDHAPVCSLQVSDSEDSPNHGRQPDWLVLDAHHVLLRAELDPKGKTRVYTVAIRCTDKKGLSSTAKVAVTVPARH